jgi:hypothetical protein
VKEALAGTTLDQDSLKTAWEGVIRTITADDFAMAFWPWFERAKKCVRIGGNFIQKSKKIKFLLPLTVCFFLFFNSVRFVRQDTSYFFLPSAQGYWYLLII